MASWLVAGSWEWALGMDRAGRMVGDREAVAAVGTLEMLVGQGLVDRSRAVRDSTHVRAETA
ncbi:hypothetical protein ACF07B_20450 [Streptomyces sp. NPDC015532]|uniref:hypothetical protein n=1 Tax=Streptomyces sp. NPDC015532 TaxID=3364960 RepID=UPI003700DECB